ncbi:Ubiquitin thioesterase OTU1 [Grifola frondosa]|uniref:Ubiquitin thioesterase OTU n=1 Tax=Grifola frondosa TaxID=5627 RepID=A0A1C7MFC4_GRIFR|nr:Ubiquitin thioesterase OTU1 [Grifola frondosa]
MLYSLHANWWKLTRPALVSMLPLPQRYYVPHRVRESFKPRLEAVELWNVPGIEQEEDEDRRSAFRLLKKKKDQPRSEKFKKVFERERVLEKARAVFDVYAKLLGDRSLFYPDVIYRQLLTSSSLRIYISLPIFPSRIPSSNGANGFISLSCGAFCYCLFSDLGSTLQALVPWPRFTNSKRPHLSPKALKAKEDERRFTLIRWGWIGLSVAAATAYIAALVVLPALRMYVGTVDEEVLEELEEVNDPAEEPEVDVDPALTTHHITLLPLLRPLFHDYFFPNGSLRLRHPKGVSTIQINLDAATVQDLQQEIFATTEIPPSQQDRGVPAASAHTSPELPVESLGLKQGEQLIVTQKAPASRNNASRSTSSANYSASAMTGLTASQVRESPIAPRVSPPKPGGPDYVQTEGGYLIHRVVPDDNSCLFSSIALVFEQNIIVADAIRKDPIKWDDATLGRSREDYISTILKPSSWGGAIELSILASHYSTEIASIDVETGRIDHFTPPPEHDSKNRCI